MDIIAATSNNNLFSLKYLTQFLLINHPIGRKDRAEVGIIYNSNTDFMKVQKEVTHHPFAEDRIVGILGMFIDVTAHPLRKC